MSHRPWLLLATIISAILVMLTIGCSGGKSTAATPPPQVSTSPAKITGATRQISLVTKSNSIMIDENVSYRAMTFNGTVPGPMIVVDEGDSVEMVVKNEDSIKHGASIHAVNGQTSLHVGNIDPGQTKSLTFKADSPGVYMYHCAPGGQGILTHTAAGMYGMIVVEPKAKKYRLEEELGRAPDLKVYILQSEIYASGRDFADGRPMYVTFNGSDFRYVRENINVRPGDYIRFYYLNVGPNLTSTFHAVGGIWKYIYYGGNPNNVMQGTQSVVSGPSDSWVVDWVVPAEGPFTLVSHAFGQQASRGAIGVISSKSGNTRSEVKAEGLNLPVPAEPKRVVDTFGPGSPDVDPPVRYRAGDTVQVQMIENSFYPKVAEVPVGTQVTWVNEDVFSFLEKELTGQHDIAIRALEVESPVLKHGEKFSFTFTKPGSFAYACRIHPYQKGVIRVYE